MRWWDDAVGAGCTDRQFASIHFEGVVLDAISEISDSRFYCQVIEEVQLPPDSRLRARCAFSTMTPSDAATCSEIRTPWSLF